MSGGGFLGRLLGPSTGQGKEQDCGCGRDYESEEGP